MENKIREYLSNPSAQMSDDIKDWFIANLSSDKLDSFFISTLPLITIENEENGKREILDMIRKIDSHRRRSRRFAWLAAAASVIACVFAAYSLFHHESPQKWESEYASYGRTKCVTLPDQTRIWLHNDSKLVYPDHFGKERIVYADGEIYAEVSADSRHPFIIETNGTRVKVLGTRFNMSSYREGNNVMLTLLSGKVEMEIPTGTGLISFSLEPGDCIEVDKETGSFSKERIDVNSFKLWTDERTFYFMDVPLKDIVLELQEAFGVRIIVKDDSCLSTHYLAMFINGESLDTILDALNCDKKMTIKKKGETYYIYSR